MEVDDYTAQSHRNITFTDLIINNQLQKLHQQQQVSKIIEAPNLISLILIEG